jgi:hypothetical protein
MRIDAKSHKFVAVGIHRLLLFSSLSCVGQKPRSEDGVLPATVSNLGFMQNQENVVNKQLLLLMKKESKPRRST